MKFHLKQYGIIYLVSLILIYFALHYNTIYFANLFTSTGELPGNSGLVILIFQIILIVFAFLIIVFKKFIYQFRKEISLSLTSFFLMFLLLEAGTRIYLQKIQPELQSQYLNWKNITLDKIYSRHQYLGYFLTPNYRSLDGLNQHNSLGYRGAEIIQPKPEEAFRIVALGGSTTYGEGVSSWQDTYPYFLKQELKKNYDQVEVINAGVGGYSSWETLINFEFRVLDLNPDLIIIYQGTNDVHTRLVKPDLYLSDNSGRRQPWQDIKEPFFLKSSFLRFIFNQMTGLSLEPAIDQFTAAPGTVIGLKDPGFNEKLGNTPLNILKQNQPSYFQQNLKNIISIAHDNNISVMLATWAWNPGFNDYAATEHYQFGFQQNNETLKELSNETQTPFFDFATIMPQAKELWFDGRHLTAAGNQLKAELFAEFIINNHLIK